MSSSLSKRIVAAVAFVVMVVVNGLAVTLPINGVETDEVSDRYSTLFAPAGFTFSIWSVIYTLLLVYTFYQLVRTNPIVEAITVPFIVSSVLNSIWILTWHYDLIWLSVIIMIGILLSLIRIANIVRHQVEITDGIGRWLAVRAPFSTYFAWICVATVANISAFLVSLGWRGGGFSEETWTVLTLGVAALIGLTGMVTNRDVAFGLVFVWAYWGILSEHRSAEGWDGAYPAVISAATVLLVALAAGSAYALYLDLTNRSSADADGRSGEPALAS